MSAQGAKRLAEHQPDMNPRCVSRVSLHPLPSVPRPTIDFNYIDINTIAANPFASQEGIMITTSAKPAASGKGRLITLWILFGLVALLFIGAGGAKLAGAAVMVELFAKIGLGQWFRYFTGLLEVAAAIGLLIPRYAS
jgi:hypothetical protein